MDHRARGVRRVRRRDTGARHRLHHAAPQPRHGHHRGRSSAQALYDERFVTFGEDDVYEQSDAAGFIRLYGLSQRVRALKDQELAAQQAADAEQEGAPPALAIA